MFEVEMNYTGKFPDKKDKWQSYNHEHKKLATLEEVKKFLKDTFGHCKTKYPIYRDKKDGTSERCGWIYATRTKNYPENKIYYDRCWVEVYEYEPKIVLI